MKAFLYTLLQNLAKIPFVLTGLIVTPFLWKYRRVPLSWMPWWTIPWVNPEDWSFGWRDHEPALNCVPKNLQDQYSGFWGFYRYHALRNGGDGLRNYAWHNAVYRQDRMILTNHPHGYTIRQDNYLSWYRAWPVGKRFIQIKFGYRMKPIDTVKGFRKNSLRWVHGAAPAWSIRIR